MPTGIPTTCQLCGQVFVDFSYKKRKFCSCACSNKSKLLPVKPRIDKNTVKTDTCWLWSGCLSASGYGLISNKQQRFVHRLVWELESGQSLTDQQVIGHICDTHNCIRADDIGVYVVDGVEYIRRGHLFLTTQYANMKDATIKKRMASGPRNGTKTHPESRPKGNKHHSYLKPETIPRGNNHSAAKLNESQVIEIRRKYKEGGVRYKDLGVAYGVRPTTIQAIVNRTNWKHVP